MVRAVIGPNPYRFTMKYSLLPVLLVTAASAVLLGLPSDVEASPWTNDRGEYFFQISQSYYTSTAYRDGSGQIQDDGDYMNLTTSAYGEIGIADDFHAQFYVPIIFARASVDDQHADQLSFGDTRLSLQASPLDLDVPTSIRGEISLPLYNRPDNAGAPIAGDHQIDLTLWLSAGGGLHALDIPMYFYLDAGYQHRTDWNFDPQIPGGTYSDAFVSHAEVGYTVANTFDVGLSSSAIFPFDPNYGAMGDESYVTVGPSLFWPINERLALDLGGYATPYSRNSGTGWFISAGVSLMDGG